MQYINRRCPSPSLRWKCASPCSQHEVFTPGPSRSLWHSSSPSCFHISHDEDDKSIVAGERLLKEALNYPHCRGCVCSRCAVFITAMFTFISTCLKYVTISTPPHSHAPLITLDISSTLYHKQMLSRKWKYFVWLLLGKPRAQSRPHLLVCTGATVWLLGDPALAWAAVCLTLKGLFV